MNLYFTNLIHFSSKNFDQRRQVLRIFNYPTTQPLKKGEFIDYKNRSHYCVEINEDTFLPYNGSRFAQS